jgi:hypothetical protein
VISYFRNGGDIIILKQDIVEEEKRLSAIRKMVVERLKHAPQGCLRIIKNNNNVQYYHREKNSSNGKYIAKKDINLAKRLAQKSYDQKILKCVEKRLKQINSILNDFEDDEIAKIYLNQHVGRKILIEPVEKLYEQRLQQWLEKQYIPKQYNSNVPVVYTNNGKIVRSKSEKIMADYFDSMGILYKYECPLKLEPYGIIYPDFTFLSPKTGKEIYWEHEGMMDNPEYARSAVKKIDLYEKNYIYPGENLILTFESSETVINMNIIKELTEKYLLV